MENRKLILITGIPATGKTTVGNLLRDKYGYKHIDFEDGISLRRFVTEQEQFVNTELSLGNIVITWGFVPDEGQIGLVKYLENYGFRLIWFDGNRLAAFREYLKAGRPESPFYLQMFRIEDSKVIERLNPLIINTFDGNGEFLDLELLIQSVLHQAFQGELADEKKKEKNQTQI